MPTEPFREAVESRRDEDGSLSFGPLFEVARQFDVSAEAVLWQLGFVFNISSDKIKGCIRDLSGQVSYWETRERDNPSERPLRFRALATQALQEGVISAGRFAEYLGVSRREAMQVVKQEAKDDAKIEIASL